jgi:lipid-binding SYLF domain-containing protein
MAALSFTEKSIMNRVITGAYTLFFAAMTTVLLVAPGHSLAADAREIEANARDALTRLYETKPAAKELSTTAEAVLVFPDVLKAGLMIGGQGGNGALFVDGKVVSYYNIAAASFGLQAGAQTFAYAMFLMTDAAREYLDSSNGWEVGVGPTLVVVDEGIAKTLTTTTAKDDVYAFIFGQKGMMAGVGLQGSKITKIDP